LGYTKCIHSNKASLTRCHFRNSPGSFAKLPAIFTLSNHSQNTEQDRVCGCCRARCENAGPADRSRIFHAGQVSNPEQNAIVNGFPASPYLAAAISKATSGSSSLSICSSRSIVDSFILSLPSFLKPQPEVHSTTGTRLSRVADQPKPSAPKALVFDRRLPDVRLKDTVFPSLNRLGQRATCQANPHHSIGLTGQSS
jgi:hypothetical protein